MDPYISQEYLSENERITTLPEFEPSLTISLFEPVTVTPQKGMFKINVFTRLVRITRFIICQKLWPINK